MDILEILIIATALSLDAFITMTANYSAYKKAGVKGKTFAVLLISFLHALFAFLGYCLSSLTGLNETAIFEYAVILLYLVLAVKVLLDKEQEVLSFIDGKKCFMQALVTSCDAFVGGITLSAEGGVALKIVVGIFAVTLFMVVMGLVLGKALENKPKTITKGVSCILFLALVVKSIFW